MGKGGIEKGEGWIRIIRSDAPLIKQWSAVQCTLQKTVLMFSVQYSHIELLNPYSWGIGF